MHLDSKNRKLNTQNGFISITRNLKGVAFVFATPFIYTSILNAVFPLIESFVSVYLYLNNTKFFYCKI